MQTIWIALDDSNDHAPFFESDTYEVDMDENLPVGASVFAISAVDEDIGANAKLTYEIIGGGDGQYFYMDSILATGDGVLRINEVRFIVGEIWCSSVFVPN